MIILQTSELLLKVTKQGRVSEWVDRIALLAEAAGCQLDRINWVDSPNKVSLAVCHYFVARKNLHVLNNAISAFQSAQTETSSRTSQSSPPSFDFLGRIVDALVNARQDKFKDVEPEIVYKYVSYVFSHREAFIDWLVKSVQDQSSGQTIIRHDPTGSGVKGPCWYFTLERAGKTYNGYVGPYVPPFGFNERASSMG